MGLISYEEKLMNCFTKFEFTDIIGFAKICKVDKEIVKRAVVSSAAIEESNLEEIICATVEAYSKLGRKERREILKLAKEIAAANEFDREHSNDSDITE